MPVEWTGWWEQERATLVQGRCESLTEPGDKMLDVGCGRGTMFDDERFDDRFVVCVDSHIWDEWAHGSRTYVCAAADALPFRDDVFDLVGSFDVLEHLDDDTVGLAEQRRVVRSGGSVVVAVPADQRLWSKHDELVGHRRRYGRADLATLVSASRLGLARLSYFYSFLWLPAWLTRASSVRATEPANSSNPIARVVRAAIGAICRLERMWFGRRDVPFGTSLWAECRK